MKKSFIITYNAMVIILLNIVYFVCNDYPKHILEFASWHSVVVSFLNFIFYVLFFSSIIIFFKKDKTVFSNQIFNPFMPFKVRFELKTLLALLLIQVATDLINAFSSLYFEAYVNFVVSFLTLISWVTIYFITTYQKNSIFKSKKYFAITFAICFALFVVSILFDFQIFNIYVESKQKYEMNSVILQNTITNLSFFSNLKNFIFDTIIGLVLMVSHVILLEQGTAKENEGNSSNRTFAVFTVRATLLIIFSMLLIFVRTLIVPSSVVKKINNFEDATKNYIADNSFYASSNCFTISRLNESGAEKNTFQNTTIKIYCNQVELSELSVNGFYKLFEHSISGNQMTITDKFQEYEINGKKVSVLEDLAICYHEESDPIVIKFSDINQQDENPILTGTIKELVSDGNVFLFVNAYAYLKKYDFDFANSIAKRYALVDFTESEKCYIEKIGYRIEYLQTFFNNEK